MLWKEVEMGQRQGHDKVRNCWVVDKINVAWRLHSIDAPSCWFVQNGFKVSRSVCSLKLEAMQSKPAHSAGEERHSNNPQDIHQKQGIKHTLKNTCR